jgi:hypothetical protein
MLYRKIIAVCSEIHKKHINTLCRLNVAFVRVKLLVHEVTIWAYRVNATVGSVQCGDFSL